MSKDLKQLRVEYSEAVEFAKMLASMREKSYNPSMYNEVLQNQLSRIKQAELAFNKETGLDERSNKP